MWQKVRPYCAPSVPPPSSITFEMWLLFWVQALSILRIGARCFGYRRKVVRTAGNTGSKVQRVSDKLVRLLARGGAPVLAEGIPCTVTIPAAPGRVRCWALGPDGSRKGEAPRRDAGGGRTALGLSPELRTLWYEVEVE